MSSAKPPLTAIPPEVDAEMTPTVRAFVQWLLARIAALEAENAALKARIEELERQARGKTP